MPITIIQTSQAPDAKPIGLSFTVTETWTSIVEVPSFSVPQQSFGGGTNIVPGVAEIISPMLVCNKSENTETISIRIYRASTDSTFTVLNQFPIAANDLVPIPLNGQFIYTGDTLDIVSSTNAVIDVTMSYTIGQAEENDVT